MAVFTSPAILLRRIDYGDNDVIISLLALKAGKIACIAKGAKKSVKRFAGVLELFSELDVAVNPGRGRGLPVLQEASLQAPFEGIRTDILKTAHAGYWSEMLDVWMEPNVEDRTLYSLLRQALRSLDQGAVKTELASILFQTKFVKRVGLFPNLASCHVCGQDIGGFAQAEIMLDTARGGAVCACCRERTNGYAMLTKGTLKQLEWIARVDWERAARVRFNRQAMAEALGFLEGFVAYHLGKELRSRRFLARLRQPGRAVRESGY